MTEFNDRTTPLDLLLTRRSGKARDMIAPGPDADQLAAILRVASRVPDHGKLAPWRFVVVADTARAKFVELIEKAYRAEKPDAGRLELQAMRDFGTQAPCLVAVMSRPNPASHIPAWEQQLSVGAACQNLLIAAHAHGFVANWLTGWAAYSPAVREALGEPGEIVAGFMFIGTAAKPLEERPRPPLDEVVRVWDGTRSAGA
jgi:nitroreductase